MKRLWKIGILREFISLAPKKVWQNGVSESLIRLVKRGLCVSIFESVFILGELQTALFNVANLINERPIGMKPGSDLDLGTYLSPNDLLLGRVSSCSPSGSYDINDHPKRLEPIQKIIHNFCRKWQRDYFPTLLVRQKWHTSRRDIRVGDVVLVQNGNAVKGKWKLAQGIEAIPGRDGIARDVKLRYNLKKAGEKYDGKMLKL